MSAKRELKAGAGYMIGNIMIKGISFITLPVFTRIMSTSDFGLYNTYVAYEAIVTILIGLGVHASIKNAKYEFSDQLNEFVSTISTLVLLASCFALSTVVLFNKFVTDLTGFTLIIIIMLVLQSFGSAMVNIINSELSLEYNYKKYLIIAGFNTFFNIGISILLIISVLKNNTFLARVIGSVIPLLFIGIYGIGNIYMRKKRNIFNKEMAIYALIIGVPLVWHYLSQQIASQFDRIMITNMKGATYTGIYSFVYTIANIFVILFYSTDNVWGVWFFSQMEKKEYKNIHVKSKYYMIFMTIIICIMMIFSREIILIMGSKRYSEGVNLFIPIIIGMYFLFLYTIPVCVEYYYKKTQFIAIMTFVSAVINIILNYIYIPRYGYQAAAYTTAISYIVMFLSHWYISNKLLKKNNVEQFYRIHEFFVLALVVVIVGGSVILLNIYPIIKYSIFFSIGLALVLFKKKEMIELLKELIKMKR